MQDWIPPTSDDITEFIEHINDTCLKDNRRIIYCDVFGGWRSKNGGIWSFTLKDVDELATRLQEWSMGFDIVKFLPLSTIAYSRGFELIIRPNDGRTSNIDCSVIEWCLRFLNPKL